MEKDVRVCKNILQYIGGWVIQRRLEVTEDFEEVGG